MTPYMARVLFILTKPSATTHTHTQTHTKRETHQKINNPPHPRHPRFSFLSSTTRIAEPPKFNNSYATHLPFPPWVSYKTQLSSVSDDTQQMVDGRKQPRSFMEFCTESRTEKQRNVCSKQCQGRRRCQTLMRLKK